MAQPGVPGIPLRLKTQQMPERDAYESDFVRLVLEVLRFHTEEGGSFGELGDAHNPVIGVHHSRCLDFGAFDVELDALFGVVFADCTEGRTNEGFLKFGGINPEQVDEPSGGRGDEVEIGDESVVHTDCCF